MNRPLKAPVLFFSFFLILAVCLLCFNMVNAGIRHEIPAEINQIAPDDSLAKALYKVGGLHPESTQSLTLTITLQKDSEPYAVLVDHLTFAHEIYLDGVLASQNIDSHAAKYDSGYAYKLFSTGDPSDGNGKTILQIRGPGVSGINVYLAQARVMRDRVETRLVCNALMLFLMALMTLAAAGLYIKKRGARFFLVFTLIGIVSIIKAVCTGELSALARIVGFSAQNYAVWNSLLSAANLFMPLAVMIYLLNIAISRGVKATLLTFGAGLTAINGVIRGPSRFYLALTTIVYLAALALSIYGCVKKKRYCAIIFVDNALYSALVTYAFLINAGVLRGGGLDFYIYPAYLGAEIYLFLFFAVFIQDFFRELQALEEKRNEYERVALLRGIGHDLKLPLSVIKMNNQMLEKYPLTEEERQECARMSTEATLELEKMTENISSFINLKAEAAPAYPASLRDSFDTAARRYSALSEISGYAFSASWEGPEASLPINPLQLERMLGNLLDNALKYSQKGSAVSLSCRVEPQKIYLTVQDNGLGMERQQMEKIFEPFYRADRSRTKEGLGLGLAVVKGIVDSLNGRIEVESEPGKGTKIALVLPVE
ncbi:MAG: HAMP domain-containing sensor histidine kinase [Clostridiaceae bacterium]|nr:HAMP domain-containing sensor histidine kinase [Clostridiaceae bacterium]